MKVEIYNIRGQKVKTLVNALLSKGKYDMIWDGMDDKKHKLASGLYICNYEIGKHKHTAKVTIIR